jgi:oligoribonuclease (3'-5' exoribonuclease)
LPEFAFAFLDCEFGGLDPELHDITEIGLIVTDYRLAQISGYDPELWKSAVPLRQALTELVAQLPRGKTIVPAGQNVRMDVQFLERGFKSCGIPYPFDYHVIDLATLFYSWSLVAGEQVSALSLRQAAHQAGLIQGAIPHRALADSRLTLESFRHYIGRLAPRSPADDVVASPAE